ncbi:MAG: cob(I)yrinic acid a,c-diamide adenosyltransferase [Muribaculaceae bacterium]|nr:cob(I)yrinic acid a,c-diamide adenosyltransferase [Muribaculaceae bacterium]
MKRIYTRTGDRGTTAIHGRVRVPKSDIRIEANGTLDELNVAIGIVRSMMPVNHPWQLRLREIQLNLMTAMSLVATRSDMRAQNPNALPATLVADTERFIDEVAEANGPSEYFILPGGTQLSAFMHQARVVARRAERRLWQLNEVDAVPEDILMYVNRLSDLFFEMSRSQLASEGLDEERWNAFAYKSKKR